MDRINIEERFSDIIQKVAKKDIIIYEGLDFVEDLDFDSIELIQLIVFVEDEFQITIEDKYFNLENLKSYSWFINTIGELCP